MSTRPSRPFNAVTKKGRVENLASFESRYRTSKINDRDQHWRLVDREPSGLNVAALVRHTTGWSQI